jgi:hypothetical protein
MALSGIQSLPSRWVIDGEIIKSFFGYSSFTLLILEVSFWPNPAQNLTPGLMQRASLIFQDTEFYISPNSNDSLRDTGYSTYSTTSPSFFHHFSASGNAHAVAIQQRLYHFVCVCVFFLDTYYILWF